MRIRPAGDSCSTRWDGQMDRHDEAKSRFSQFCECASQEDVHTSAVFLLCIKPFWTANINPSIFENLVHVPRNVADIFTQPNSVVTMLRGISQSNRGSSPSTNKGFISSPKRPDQRWGQPVFLTMGTRSSFHGDKAAGVRRRRDWKWVKLQVHSSILFHACDGKNLPLPVPWNFIPQQYLTCLQCANVLYATHFPSQNVPFCILWYIRFEKWTTRLHSHVHIVWL
jgi:hypothetical protein